MAIIRDNKRENVWETIVVRKSSPIARFFLNERFFIRNQEQETDDLLFKVYHDSSSESETHLKS